ncbi:MULTISPECIES: hypothetical protein [unclassified Cohnella]
MSMRAWSIITVIVFLALNLWLMGGGHSGRGQDSYEYQTDDTAYAEESP